MEVRTVSRLAEIMSRHQLTELQVSEGDLTIMLKRQPGVAMAVMPEGDEVEGVEGNELSETGSNVSAVVENIVSPMPGMFYASSSPDAQPFVKPGDVIKPGMVVCIIEAMKVMNEIKSDISGTVSRVLVETGSPVEYNQPLFEITVD